MQRKIPFAGLHNHSEFSNMRMKDAIAKLDDLIQTSADLGYSGIVITEHDCLSGSIKALEKAEEIHRQNPNFTVGLGNEIYLVDEQPVEEVHKFYHFLLIARTAQGYEYLKELSTRAWKRSKVVKGIRRVPTFYSDIEEVVKTQGDLIASSACLGSRFSYLVNKYIETDDTEDKKNIVSFIRWCQKIFGKDYFYIEIQSSINEEQVIYNKKAMQIAKAIGIKVVLTEDVHYLTKADSKIHRAFVNSARSNNNEDDNAKDFYEGCYLKTEDELRERMNCLSDSEFAEVCQNTVNIVNSLESYSLKKSTIVPLRKLPPFEVQHLFSKWYSECPTIAKFAYTDEEQDRFILSEIEKGFLFRKQEFNDTNVKRIEAELDVVNHISDELNQRLSAYYNLMQVIIDLMWTKGDSIVGIARGSATAFYILYLMGITQINPITYNLPYFRHLNYARAGAMADVDCDTESSKRGQILQTMVDYFGEEHFLNIATFKTETSRSAILTCCRGMDIPLEEAQQIADTIPKVRGMNYTINDCLYGSDDKEPAPLFKKVINGYDGLLEACLKIEGLISGVGIHASGVAITNDKYINQTSAMKAPNGTLITAFDLGDCEKAGIIKYDLLTVSTLDEIHTTLNLLLKDGRIEWKGSLKDTYNAYLHPDVLDYTTPKMFALLGTDKATNIFQLSTNMSMQACKALKPKSLMEMTLVNSVIRLAGEQGKESPTDKYVRYKNDMNEWYKDLKDYGIAEYETGVLEKHLKQSNGLCLSQETLMLMAMDKKISGMTLAESDLLRKAISKKKHKLVLQSQDTFYQRGQENGVRKVFLDYVWNEQFALSLSYSFALSHGVAYSCIGLQQLNLLYHYPPIYSTVASLLVNSSSTEDNSSDKIDYGKIATAAFNAKKQGANFAPANVNTADIGFSLDADKNLIYWGLKGISGINTETAEKIINNRPYNDLEEVVERNNLTKVQALSLIKSGACDFVGLSRKEMLSTFLNVAIKDSVSKKDKITANDIALVDKLNLLPQEYKICLRYLNFNKYIQQDEFKADKIKNKVWRIAKDIAVPFFEQHYVPFLKEETEYKYVNGGILFSNSAYQKVYKQKMFNILEITNTKEFVDKVNRTIKNQKFTEEWNKYCSGSEEDWEFDSICFYLNKHALANVKFSKYNISSFNELSETPIIESENYYRDKLYYQYKISRICGTVIDSDRTKHIVKLLTPDNEVVECKFYAGAFIHYNSVIKEERDGKNTVVERSWFERGTKLVVTGYRNGDMFKPKTYKDSIYRHSVALIENVRQDGILTLRELRYGEKEFIRN